MREPAALPRAIASEGELPVKAPTLPSRWWLLPAMALRAGLALLLCGQANRMAGRSFRFFIEGGDTPSYFLPVENFLASGWWVVNPSQPLSQAGRMPGYGLTYLLFRCLASPVTA